MNALLTFVVMPLWMAVVFAAILGWSQYVERHWQGWRRVVYAAGVNLPTLLAGVGFALVLMDLAGWYR